MTDSPIRRSLNQWRSRLATVGRNLMGLFDAESTRAIRIRLRDTADGYAGDTLERASHAVEALDVLLEQYALLANVVDEAAGLAGRSGVFHAKNEERARDLLEGRSVPLKMSRQVCVDSGGLLKGADREQRTTPSEVLAVMERFFADTRDALSSVADATSSVRPRLAALGQEAVTLGEWAKTLSVTGASVPDTVKRLARVERDPLGCAGEVDQIEAGLAQWRMELQGIDAGHKAALASIERGKASLAELRNLVARSSAAFSEASRTLADHEGLLPPSGGDTAQFLDDWLRDLERTVVGHLVDTKAGLARWERECDNRLAAERASYVRNMAGLDEVDDLRGLLTALRAKADALRERGLDPGDAADNAYRQARAVLDTPPVDITAAKILVGQFVVSISAAADPSPVTASHASSILKVD